ncbi:ABC transporter ATP-binding protein [Asticcacaulis taihuensis]|uniref:ABC transporter ATP-binding protein n=1 Tax=Asticcacaulis taihuensis TaxID=260084 RepID=UPI003F7C34CD
MVDKPESPPKAMRPPMPSLWPLLKPYKGQMVVLVLLTVAGNALNLAVPKVVADAIDAFTAGRLDLNLSLLVLSALAVGTFLFGNLQNVVQTIASERVARDLRTRLAEVVSEQTYTSIETLTPSKLLTNFTSDVDAIKTFVAQAAPTLISSIAVIMGASGLLLWLNWQLALPVLATLPLIALSFFLVMSRVRKLFGQIQGIVDVMNRVLTETIVGAPLIRLVHAEARETSRFAEASERSRVISMNILRQFASMIPLITFLTNVAVLIILSLGGHFVIADKMTVGQLSAFLAYLTILVFPIIIIGFTSMSIGQAQASYKRISAVLNAPPPAARGETAQRLTGAIEVKDLVLAYGERKVLKGVSFDIAPGSRTAIVGPTAAGKSQLLFAMTGLLAPTSGQVLYDGRPIDDFTRDSLYAQIAFVFQDSQLFNLTLRENIAFNTSVDGAQLKKAIETAELQNFIAGLPQGLDTVAAERGLSLSGGQKQRIMLARALALNPRVLFLDDFTARVDMPTESRILANVRSNYPDLTLISITQKIAPGEDFDQIVLLMEGEVLAVGTHDELARSSPEFGQILRSQRSTETYEMA